MASTTGGRCAALAIAALVVVAACGPGPDETPVDRATEAGWERLPDSPLTPRSHALAFGVGDELLLLGGTTAPPCPPAASCVDPGVAPLRDGAIFDFTSTTWRPTAPAPVPLWISAAAVLDGTIYLLYGGRPWRDEPGPGSEAHFLAYDLREDAWRELPVPPADEDMLGWLHLVATDDAIVAYYGSHEDRVAPDLIFDPESKTWTELPVDPLVPSFGRVAVWTGSRLVLLGPEAVPNPGSEAPAFSRAAAYTPGSGTWRRLPDSEVIGGSWAGAGDLIVSPMTGCSDGGEMNGYGRCYPHGGVLDPATEEWSALPDDAPDVTGHPHQLLTWDHLVLAGGRILDVDARVWSTVPELRTNLDGGEAEATVAARLVVWGGYRGYLDDAEFVSDGYVLPIR